MKKHEIFQFDGEFIALPVDTLAQVVEFSFTKHNEPVIQCYFDDEVVLTKVLTFQEINDMIDSLTELKRLAGG